MHIFLFYFYRCFRIFAVIVFVWPICHLESKGSYNIYCVYECDPVGSRGRRVNVEYFVMTFVDTYAINVCCFSVRHDIFLINVLVKFWSSELWERLFANRKSLWIYVLYFQWFKIVYHLFFIDTWNIDAGWQVICENTCSVCYCMYFSWTIKHLSRIILFVCFTFWGLSQHW